MRFIVGARLDFRCGRSLLVYPTDRAAYGRLAGSSPSAGAARPRANAISTSPISIPWARGMIMIALPEVIGGAARGTARRISPAAFPAMSISPASISTAAMTGAGWRDWRPWPAHVGTPLVAVNDVHAHDPRAPAAAGCADLHPRALHHRGGGLSPLPQCRAASEIPGGDGPALRRSSRGAGPDGGDRRALPLLPRRAALRISRRADARRAARPRRISSS